MTVLCPSCRQALHIPPEKESVPGLRVRCARCKTVFPVAPAARPAAAPAPPPPAAPPPARAGERPTVSPRRPARAGGPAWRRCANHPDVPSQGVCTSCGKGWCGECVRRQGNATICATCDALCVPTAEREAREARARQRARPLSEELGTVFRYPLTNKVAFVLLSIFVGVFSVAASFAAFGAGFGVLFSQGLLYSYAFTAINRVSTGNLGDFMPEVGDVTDLAEPLKVGVAALIVSTGPLVAMTFLVPPADVLGRLGGQPVAALVAEPTPTPEPTLAPEVQAILDEPDADAGEGDGGEGTADAGEAAGGEPGAGDEPAAPLWAIGAYALAILWKILYSPIALVAGAVSRSFLSTLNPLPGLGAIRRMGSVYWSAMLVYTAIAVGEVLIGSALSFIPFAGGFLKAFVQSYAYLAVGCLLGLAVFKKAPELGLD